MKLAVGLIEGTEAVNVELLANFSDADGRNYAPGRYRFETELTLTSSEPEAAFAVDDIVIGIGFHWERKERHS